MTKHDVYRAGPCPVCGDFSHLALLKAVDTTRVFFFCDACGGTWIEPPPRMTLVNSPMEAAQLAPNGYRPATLEEIREAGYEKLARR